MENQVVKIGEQIWCTKNLDVSNYRNGDVIPQVQDAEQWANLTSGAWCYYANKTENGVTYGKLYNWYAVNDPRGLAPNGFHIPSKTEWKTLPDFFGGPLTLCVKLISTTGWYEKRNATNESGFSCLPGGQRSRHGSFECIGSNGIFWSSTEASNKDACDCLFHSDGYVSVNCYVPKNNGLSVRCLMDTDR